MPFIQNTSLYNIERGFHFDAGENSFLIQISDPDMEFPKPKKDFRKIFQFKFLDLEDLSDPMSISNEQAKEIARILKEALASRANVIVHCHMGVCRSGAVAEAGVVLGFDDTETYRQPNILVKQKIFKELGFFSTPFQEEGNNK